MNDQTKDLWDAIDGLRKDVSGVATQVAVANTKLENIEKNGNNHWQLWVAIVGSLILVAWEMLRK